ncbi:MAG: hypothetical protein ACLPJH_11545 [Myxococcaceae bacterium]
MTKTALLAYLVCLAACGGAREETPEASYRAFAAAANKGEDAVAFARLTTASQQAIRDRLAGLSAASGGSLREDAAGLVFRGGRASPITAVQLLKKERDRATVAVSTREQTQELTLRREGSEWRVELVLVQPASP